jgi:hypothetical protein
MKLKWKHYEETERNYEFWSIEIGEWWSFIYLCCGNYVPCENCLPDDEGELYSYSNTNKKFKMYKTLKGAKKHIASIYHGKEGVKE